MDRWVGKVAVVTGASAGIGVSIVKELVDRGMVVVGLARRVETVEELAKTLSDRKGKLYAVKADVCKEEDVAEAFDWVRKNLGIIHVLVNNAGYAPYTFIANLQREQYSKIKLCFDTNVVGVIMCTNEALKLMREKGIDDGHIVNINSVSGHYIKQKPGFYVYNASKHSLRVITEGLRRELLEAKSMIRVSSISPGYVPTEIRVAGEVPNLDKYVADMPAITADDVTASVIHALAAPPEVQIAEIIVRPVGSVF
ncbi:farnesol dehydrogenase-like [Ischnura elegans]|uniref:farnesol dehydrogenase-like n=1 Tax=Ischnura elegans TaxID=197161 RepID=UPI001ED8ACDB|nr:farnesol dehydrogenase-like [Ischnura elegans]